MADSTAKSEELKDCRVGSPYHQKCVPPYCDTAQTDRFVVAKLQRDELEDRYIVVTNENVSLKRLMNELRKQVQRLNTQAQRQERIDKREGKVIPHCDDDFINNLQQQNRTLQAKVNVLTQQLQNHSRMHARVHGAANAKEAAISPTRNRIELTPEKDLKPIPEENNKEFPGRSEIEQLKYRIRELEQELKRQRELYERRISELEAESSTSFQRNRESAGNDVDRVMDNVEIIRLRRLNKRQAAQIITLSNHNDAVEKELGPLRKTVENLNKESEELMQRLQKEKQKLQTVQHQAAQSQSLSQAVKALEEQVLDLQKERVALQEHNEKLLSLTSQHSENELNLKKQAS